MQHFKTVLCLSGWKNRVYPLTYHQPSFLLPLLNQPLLFHILTQLRKAGCRHLFFLMDDLSASYLRPIREAIHSFEFKTALFQMNDLQHNRHQARDNFLELIDTDMPILMLQNPHLDTLDLEKLFTFHQEKQGDCTLRLLPDDDQSPQDRVKLDEEGLLLEDQDDPDQTAQTALDTGTYLMEQDILEELLQREHDLLNEPLIDHLAEVASFVYGFVAPDYIAEIKSPESYLQSQQTLLEKELVSPVFATERKEEDATIWMGEHVICDPSVKFKGLVLLGSDCLIGKNVTIEGPTILHNHCRVFDGAKLSQCVIWDSSIIENEAELSGCLIGAEVRVESKAKVYPNAVIGDFSILGSGRELRTGEILGPYSSLLP